MVRRSFFTLGLYIYSTILSLMMPIAFNRFGKVQASEVSVERQHSQVSLKIRAEESVEWTVSDSRNITCVSGTLTRGSHSVVFPKVTTSDDLTFSMKSINGEVKLQKTIIGVHTPSKLPKIRDAVRIYQLVPRTYLASGIGEENQGKLDGLTINRLQELRDLGVDYLWLTGLLEHASPKNTDRDGVKGEAGSYFAISDSWDIDDGLGGLKAFENFIDRAHQVGLRVIIDLVPNHTARVHKTDVIGKCGVDFGSGDLKDTDFAPNNSYYYLPDNTFVPPQQDRSNAADGEFDTELDTVGVQLERPAKATGNDVFSPNPSSDDWYETAKLNYGWDYRQSRGYFEPTPLTWFRVLDVARYWLSKGVDGFRVDFAHSVPMEFWKFFVQRVRGTYPHAFLLAEAYESDLRMKLPGFSYDALLRAGFDSVYSSEAYWKMRAVAENRSTLGETGLPGTSRALSSQMIAGGHLVTHYMENHDEIRLASRFFTAAGGRHERSQLGWAMTGFLGLLPGNLLIHGGQELEEDATIFGPFAGDMGKTSIFDYVYQSRIFDWTMGNGSPLQDTTLRRYKKLLDLKGQPPFNLRNSEGSDTYIDLMSLNWNKRESRWISAYVRYKGNKKYLVVINADPYVEHDYTIHFTQKMNDDSHGILKKLNLEKNDKRIRFRDVLLDLNWEAQEPSVGGVGIPSWVLFRSEGIPSGLYLGKIPRSSTRVLEILEEG